MAATATEIANYSLAVLGAKRISDITDDTIKSARIMNLHYAQARQEVIRAGKWNFAIQRKTLSQHADAPEYGYAYQYSLPADFMRLDRVNEVSIWDTQRSDWFEIENGLDSGDNSIGPVLLTNATNIRIRYVADITDTQRFDPLFTQALTVLLAAKGARAITGSERKEQELRNQYEAIDLPHAQQVDGAETMSGENPPIIDAISRSFLVKSRGSSGLDYLPDGPTNPSAFPTP